MTFELYWKIKVIVFFISVGVLVLCLLYALIKEKFEDNQ